MTAAIGAIGSEGSGALLTLESAWVEAQARQLRQYVQTGGGEPRPPATMLAELSAGPLPIDQVQQVQALLAETRRLADTGRRAPAPTPVERAERFQQD